MKRGLVVAIVTILAITVLTGGYFLISNNLNKDKSCELFSSKLGTCSKYSCEFSHPITEEMMTREIVGFEDETCKYIEEIPDGGQIVCNFPKGELNDYAEFYEEEMSEKELDSISLLGEGNVENPIVNAFRNEDCTIGGYGEFEFEEDGSGSIGDEIDGLFSYQPASKEETDLIVVECDTELEYYDPRWVACYGNTAKDPYKNDPIVCDKYYNNEAMLQLIENCYRHLAADLGDPNLCMMLRNYPGRFLNPYVRDICFVDVVDDNEEIIEVRICDAIEDLFKKRECYHILAIRLNDPSICDKIESPNGEPFTTEDIEECKIDVNNS